MGKVVCWLEGAGKVPDEDLKSFKGAVIDGFRQEMGEDRVK
jgi:hypothetical protein